MARIPSSGSLLGSGSAGLDGDLCKEDLTPYLATDDGDAWDFSNVPTDSHDDICASHCGEFDATSCLCYSRNVALLEDANVPLDLRCSSDGFQVSGCIAYECSCGNCHFFAFRLDA